MCTNVAIHIKLNGNMHKDNPVLVNNLLIFNSMYTPGFNCSLLP